MTRQNFKPPRGVWLESDKQKVQIGGAGGAGGGQFANERQGFGVIALAAGCGAMGGGKQGGAQIGDEQCRLAEGGELLQAGHDAGARKKWGSGVRRGGGVPVEEAVLRVIGEALGEELSGGRVERVIKGCGKFRVLGGLGFEFSEAEGDGGLDLLGEVEISAGDVREQLVDEVQATEVVAGPPHFSGWSRLLISSTNSVTSRNSL